VGNGDWAEPYRDRLPLLEELRASVEQTLVEALTDLGHIDRVASRVKSEESFTRKASSDLYTEPLEEIEDQVAVRVLVYFESDIARITDRLNERFNPVEDFRHEPARDEEFGYLTHHLVLAIPNHLKPVGWETMDPMPTTFEVQIRTLFMHAYAEPQHNLAYKAPEDLPRDLRRQLAWIAASAWGADRAYESVLERFTNDR
jgi:ppGpp synthetase/RelA/SpoT-type nucleotidyltranferase